MGTTYYSALMEVRNRWFTGYRTPKNLCKRCLLKVNCSKLCKELSNEVLDEVSDQVGIKIRVNGLRNELSVTIQSVAAAEKIDLLEDDLSRIKRR